MGENVAIPFEPEAIKPRSEKMFSGRGVGGIFFSSPVIKIFVEFFEGSF
jgi:hypothetical protein